MTYALAVESARTGYGDAQVIENASLAVGQGEVFALLGKNGAGKTTLLRTIMGLHPLWSGSISVCGKNVTGWKTSRIAGLGLAYAPQERSFFPDLSVDENLRLGSLRVSDETYRRRRERVITYFPYIGSRLRQRTGSLSGGEQSMLKVARALVAEPDLVLLDEVSEGLQPLAVDRVKMCLSAERERGVSILLVEQNIDFVSGLAQRYALMGSGRVVGTGDVQDAHAAARIVAHLAI